MQGAAERIKGRRKEREDQMRGKDEQGEKRRGAFSGNGLALISLSRSAAKQIWDGERA